MKGNEEKKENFHEHGCQRRKTDRRCVKQQQPTELADSRVPRTYVLLSSKEFVNKVETN